MYRVILLILEFIAGFIGTVLVLSFLIIWRLSAAPVSSTFLTPYFESAIGDVIPGTRTTIWNSVLTWDNADHSIALRADNVHLVADSGAPIADVPEIDIRISVLGLMLGRLVPASLMIDHPQVKLTRAADGTLYFGGMTTQGNSKPEVLKAILANIADDAAHALFMRKLQVNRAVFDVHDEINNHDWTISIPEISVERLNGNLEGQAKVELTQKDQTALLAVHYNYDHEQGQHNLEGHFSDINPSFLAGGNPGSKAAIFDLPLTGEISFGFDNKLDVVAGALDIHGDAGTLNYPDFWDQPRAIKSLDLKGGYEHASGRLGITNAVIDFGGPKLTLSASGKSPAVPAAYDLDFDLALALDNVPMSDYAAIWPKSIIPDARDWIAASLSKGNFNHGEASFKGTLKWSDLSDIAFTQGTGKVSASGADVKYLPDMPSVEGASADATFDLDHITINVTSGHTGDLKVQPSAIEITDFQKDTQNIDLPIKLAGPIPSILRLIDAPRFRYASAIGLTPDDVTGNADGTADLSFPLLKDLKMDQVMIKASANLEDVASTKLVPGYDITQGNFAFDLDKTGFSAKGSANLDKVPLQVDWKQAFAESADRPLRQATITSNLTGEQWTLLGFDALSKTEGPVAVNLEMLQKDKSSTAFSGTLDMQAAALDIEDLNWKKPAGAAAKLQFTANMPAEGNITVTSVSMTGPQVSIKGTATLDATTLNPVALDLEPFAVGRTDAKLHFIQAAGDNGALKFEASGKSFDVSGLRGGNDPEHASPRPKEYHIRIDKLWTSDNGFIADAHGFVVRDKDGWSAISLQGLADGGHQLNISLEQKEDGHRAFVATCDDFGKALKGMGFTDTVKSGKVEIYGSSTPENPRVIEGKVKIGGFQVKDLPVLANLMNATSPFGLFDLLTGTMDFDSLSGKFRWQGDEIELKQIRAVGSSVGMNVDGKINMNTGAANLYGTMAPFSLFNRILNYIPIIGDMLTGGENQGVLAVSYTIKGTLDKPDIGVNPVSLLTPGFLRNIFFGGDDSDDTSSSDTATPVIRLPPAETNINK